MPESRTSQPLKMIWVILAGIVAFVTIGPKPQGEKPPSSTGAEKRDAKENDKLDVSEISDYLKPLQDFFAAGEDEFPLDLNQLYKKLRNLSPRLLIATLPDPVDSKLGYAFDQVIAGIQSAIAEDDYTFDRSWLPWELDKKKIAQKKMRRAPFEKNTQGCSCSGKQESYVLSFWWEKTRLPELINVLLPNVSRLSRK